MRFHKSAKMRFALLLLCAINNILFILHGARNINNITLIYSSAQRCDPGIATLPIAHFVCMGSIVATF